MLWSLGLAMVHRLQLLQRLRPGVLLYRLLQVLLLHRVLLLLHQCRPGMLLCRLLQVLLLLMHRFRPGVLL